MIKNFYDNNTKEQAASIASQKVDELLRLIPLLRQEIKFDRGESNTKKDNFNLRFKNDSVLDVIAAANASRGQRATGGLMEEVILIDQTLLNEIIIPTMNIDRALPDGTRDEKEVINKSQMYITTAGWKDSFAYEKLIQILLQQIIDPTDSVAIGGTWRVPVAEKLLRKTFIEELKLDDTYSDSSFLREYESEWSGESENAFFSSEKFDAQRVLNMAETEAPEKATRDSEYIIGVDVGRKNCTTEAVVIKNTPTMQGSSSKSVVNIITMEAEHFERQAINLKRLYFKFKARTLVVDGNGLGVGLIDYLVRPQIDKETGEEFPPFGVENDDSYDQFTTEDTIKDAVYVMKANAGINTIAHTYTQVQILSGKLRFLIDENRAKAKMLETSWGKRFNAIERAEYLKPYVATTILKSQMLNLTEQREGVNIILTQTHAKIKKDKFSALEYALYYIKDLEDRGHRKKRRLDLKNLMLFG